MESSFLSIAGAPRARQPFYSAKKLPPRGKQPFVDIPHARDAKRQAPVIAPQPVRQVKAEQPVGRLRRKAECFLSGMSIGAAVMLLIVWLLLLAAGVI